MSFYIRDDALHYRLNDLLIISMISISILIPLLFVFKLHTELLRFNNFSKFVLAAKALTIYAFIFFVFIIFLNFYNIPRSIAILHPILFFVYYVISRRALSKLVNYYINMNETKGIKKKVLLYGTDARLISLSNIINESNEFSLKGFVEKDKEMIGRNINGFPIYNLKNIKEIIFVNNIDLFVMSPSDSDARKRYELIEKIIDLNISIITPRSLWARLYKKQEIFRDDVFNIHDLVGRKQIEPFKKLLERNVKNKIILITGAGGSIGKQLTMEIKKLSPRLIIALDNNEFS